MLILTVIVILAGIGLVAGLGLALAARFYAVKEDPRVEEVEDILPKGQCGACGFAGCKGYAEAVVEEPDVPPTLCIPGGERIAQMIARITGKRAVEVEKKISVQLCTPYRSKAAGDKFLYKGVADCTAASLLMGGQSLCQFSCLGFGDCARNCPFHAIEMVDGRPWINADKCTGCGICVRICPRSSLKLITASSLVHVFCRNTDKGSLKCKICKAACIGCGICAKTCPYNVIVIESNLAKVDYSRCPNDCPMPCVEKCPTGAIMKIAFLANPTVQQLPVNDKEVKPIEVGADKN